MIIDFYHIDAFEIANYEPIWRALKNKGVDARIVAATGNQNTAEAGWFDFDRFKQYCEARNIPYQTHKTPESQIGVTTQNANILREYAHRIRLMYGPVIYPFAWALQPHSVYPFHAVLTHGAFYQDRFSQWLPKERLPIIGYPRYDDFFAKKINKEALRKKWGIKSNKPVLAFLPTCGDNTAFDTFLPAILQLKDEFEILIRPHHCTIRFEPHRMQLIKNSELRVLEDTFDLSDIYAVADLVVSDVRSGGLFEGSLCGLPCVGLVKDQKDIIGWLHYYQIESMLTLCNDASLLKTCINEAIDNNIQTINRRIWADRFVSFRDGTAAEKAAEAIILFATTSTYSHQSHAT